MRVSPPPAGTSLRRPARRVRVGVRRPGSRRPSGPASCRRTSRAAARRPHVDTRSAARQRLGGVAGASRSEETIDGRPQRGEQPRGAARPGRGPTSSSSTSVWPWNRSSRFHAVCPCRHSTSRRAGGVGAAPAVRTLAAGEPAAPGSSSARPWRPAHLLGQLDRRAVLPDALEGVVDPLLGVLDVHDDVDVVEQHPAALALALAAHRLGAQPAQSLLDRVDDRADLPVVGRRAEHEDVGDDELVAHVEGEDVVGELVGGRLGGGDRQLAGTGRRRSRAPVSHDRLRCRHGAKSAPRITITSATVWPRSLVATESAGSPSDAATRGPRPGSPPCRRSTGSRARLGVVNGAALPPLMNRNPSSTSLRASLLDQAGGADAVLDEHPHHLADGVLLQRPGEQRRAARRPPRRRRGRRTSTGPPVSISLTGSTSETQLALLRRLAHHGEPPRPARAGQGGRRAGAGRGQRRADAGLVGGQREQHRGEHVVEAGQPACLGLVVREVGGVGRCGGPPSAAGCRP